MTFNPSRIAAAFTGLVLLTGMGISAQATLAQTSSTPAPTMQRRSVQEKHPELRAALRNLQQAKLELQQGAHDFKGERVEALKATNRAIAEVEQALKVDRY